MARSIAVSKSTGLYPAITQSRLLERFANPSDCLAAHMMLECSEVLAGVKPANLISLVNRTRDCGRNLFKLWECHGDELADRLPSLTFRVMQTRERALLLLCYKKEQLERHLSHGGVQALLRKAGYPGTSSAEQLDELCRRVATNDTFPHEIGLFIGYPAKDVAAFMGLVRLPFACQGPWKIYGAAERSLGLAEQYRCCRQRMGEMLASARCSVSEQQITGGLFF